jgi:hypothetical protein
MKDLDGATSYGSWIGGKYVLRSVTPEEDGSYTARICFFGALGEGEQRFVARRSKRNDAIFAVTAQLKLFLTKQEARKAVGV